MNFSVKLLLYGTAAFFLSSFFLPAQAQTGFETPLKFNKTVHNFGKISINAGKQHCEFEFTNTGDKPIAINNIISSCGCAEPVWPKHPIMPGQGGKIEVTFLNDQGPYPFEKTLTVYTSASNKPILLRISGIVYKKESSLKEIFPVAIGLLGVMNNHLRLGQIEQGYVKSGSTSIANLSSKEVSVTFSDVSKGLFLTVNPVKIQAGEIAEITYTVNTNEQEHWGNTIYSANVVCNGVKASTKLNIDCMIIDHVSSLSKEEKSKASMVLAKNSSISLGTVAKGKPVEAIFHLRNTGASDLIIHKVDTNDKQFTVTAPNIVKPGSEFTVKAVINPDKFKGEQVFTITLITNAPNRPLVNLFVAANIQ